VSIRDVTSAVDWLDANRERFGIGDRIGLLGNSSGGHQALLAAMRPGDPRFTDRALAAAAKVDLVVLCWAVIDPVARYEWALGTGNRPELVTKHLDYWGDVETMRSGSPQHLLDTGTFGHLPRVLAIQGEDDANLPSDMLPRFARSYANVGGLIQVELIANRGHNFVIRDPQDVESQRSINLIAEFVQSGGRPL
jgi:acetyl esterase/lipase